MTSIYRVTDAAGNVVGEFATTDMAAVRAAVAAHPGAKVKAVTTIDNPCAVHPAFEADNCPGCGTAARIN